MRRLTLLLFIAAAPIVLTAGPAFACAGLVGENGTIQLTRTTTLAAYHNGVERYVTGFEFTGQGQEVGSIVPLPGVPTKVERGGDWTLQRLEREVQPPVPEALAFAGLAKTAHSAQVILETKVDALDITILRGGGKAVGKWAIDHGFLLTPDAPEVLDFYSRRSPIFMAARFDAARATALGQNQGDGTPIMLTIPTREPWVPLRILGLGQGKANVVSADVFLLTDREPLLRAGTGLTLARSERASSGLLTDLHNDKHMGWVPSDMWLSFLRLDVPAGRLNYDLAVSTHQGTVPSAVDAGRESTGLEVAQGSDTTLWSVVGGVVLASLGVVVFVARRAKRSHAAAAQV